MDALLKALRCRGWTVRLAAQRGPLLPRSVAARYAGLDPAVCDFLSSLEVGCSADEVAWFLTREDYVRPEGSGFRWNEYEHMALDAVGADPALADRVVRFWNRHFPFMLAVRSNYDYLALRLDDGVVVHGYAPEWELPTPVSPSFTRFLRDFEDAALSPHAAWPYSVFFGDD